MRELIWVTADGREYLISDMETSHIERCIARIVRKGGRWRAGYLPRLQLELQIRQMGLSSSRRLQP